MHPRDEPTADAATGPNSPSATHTNGPWYFWEHYSGEPDAYVVGPENFVTVAEVRNGCDDVVGDPKANARLIAASPCLLAALETVVEHWTSQFEGNGHLAPPWCAQARAAISKATGAA